MDIKYLLIQLLIAIVCAAIAGILVPREIPGKAIGLVIIGLSGVYLGGWTSRYLQQQYDFNPPFLTWEIEGVQIIPSIIGSAIVLYLVTAFLSWGRYGNR